MACEGPRSGLDPARHLRWSIFTSRPPALYCCGVAGHPVSTIPRGLAGIVISPCTAVHGNCRRLAAFTGEDEWDFREFDPPWHNFLTLVNVLTRFAG